MDFSNNYQPVFTEPPPATCAPGIGEDRPARADAVGPIRTGWQTAWGTEKPGVTLGIDSDLFGFQ